MLPFPVILVVKPGKERFRLNACKVNSVTVNDAYPLLFIDETFSRFPKAHLEHMFWKILLNEMLKDKAAFTVLGRLLCQFVIKLRLTIRFRLIHL